MKILSSFLLALLLLSGCSHTPRTGEGTAPEAKSAELRTGVTLRYEEQGSGSGQPVIFLHGYTDSHRSFDLVRPLLPPDIHAYLLDQRGHGDSERPECCYAQQDFAKDVVAFMDALGLQRATIVGHSMGSFIAQQVALESPERVRALVLIGSAPTANNETVRGLNNEVSKLQDPIPPAFVRDFQASTVSKPVPDSYLSTLVSESLKVPARVWKATLEGLIAGNHSAQLGTLSAPTLVIGGELDSIFPAAEQRKLSASLPHASLVLYPQVGHAPHAEAPQRFMQDLTEFLRSVR